MKTKPYLWIILSFIGVLVVALSFTISIAARGDERVSSQDSLVSPYTAPSLIENVGTAFTYQGQLMDGGNPANGTYDFSFSLFTTSTGGTKSLTVYKENLAVTDGLFTTQLDFGGVYVGSWRWLEIGIRPGTSKGSYTTLTPRQELTPAPIALALPGLRTQQNATSPNLIGGYSGNTVTSGVVGATIGGGGASSVINHVTDSYGTIGGGRGNLAGNDDEYPYSAQYVTISGGLDNIASGILSTVSGGYDNHASGYSAAIPGGTENTAAGDYSFAAGLRAKANNNGCFVWSDTSLAMDLACDTDNRWVARAHGGVYFYTGFFDSPIPPDTYWGVYVEPRGNVWNMISDRAIKENFSSVDSRAVLESLASVPLYEYNLKSQDPDNRHIGPVAQDFYATFGYGVSDTAINMGDADGVTFAAIQGLYEILQEKDTQIQELETRLLALEGQIPKSESPSVQISLFNWLVAGWILVVSVILVKRRFSGVRP